MATTPEPRIRIPAGLTLGDLLDAIDLRSNTIDAGRSEEHRHAFALGVAFTGLSAAMAGDTTLLRTDYATVAVIIAPSRDYLRLVALADDHTDAVEHARRLAAERSIDDDGPVAA